MTRIHPLLIATLFLLFNISLAFIAYNYAGLSEDQLYNQKHGKILFEYFTQGDPRPTLSPFLNGKLIIFPSSADIADPVWRYMNFFGGVPDTISHVIRYLFGRADDIQAVSAVNTLYATILICAASFAAYSFWPGNKLVFLIGIVFFALCPRILGHAFNNFKDIPLACFFMLSYLQLVYLWKELPEISLNRCIWLSVVLALCLATRVVGIIAFFNLFFIVGAWLVFCFPKERFTESRKVLFGKIIAGCAAIVLCALFIARVFWPYYGAQGFTALWEVIKLNSSLDVFSPLDLFEGKWINRWEIPWYYIPKWFWLVSPLHVIAGLSAFAILSFTQPKKDRLLGYLLFIIFCLPVTSQIILKANTYNDGRHFLFCYVGLCLLAVIGWIWYLKFAFSRIKWQRIILVSVMAASFFPSGIWMAQNAFSWHLYFNPLSGGIKNAFQRYELDFWGRSNRQAAEWINEHADSLKLHEQMPLRVRTWYGTEVTTTHFLDASKNIRWVSVVEDSADWDIWVFNSVAGKHFQDWIKNWPPPNTIHEIKVDQVPVIAIIQNPRLQKSSYRYTRFFNEGFQAHNHKDYPQSNVFFHIAESIQATDANLFNNIGYNYFLLKDPQKARIYFQKALSINPNHTHARNNLGFLDKQ